MRHFMGLILNIDTISTSEHKKRKYDRERYNSQVIQIYNLRKENYR